LIQSLHKSMPVDYLERILKARVYDVAVETPLEIAPALSARLNNTLLLKREDMQPVFSFKLRGAYNKMAALPAARLRRGVINPDGHDEAQKGTKRKTLVRSGSTLLSALIFVSFCASSWH